MPTCAIYKTQSLLEKKKNFKVKPRNSFGIAWWNFIPQDKKDFLIMIQNTSHK